MTPAQARNNIIKHLEKGAGIYIDGRFFNAKVTDNALQVYDGYHWHDVQPGAQFRDHEGRNLFIYEAQ